MDASVGEFENQILECFTSTPIIYNDPHFAITAANNNKICLQ